MRLQLQGVLRDRKRTLWRTIESQPVGNCFVVNVSRVPRSSRESNGTNASLLRGAQPHAEAFAIARSAIDGDHVAHLFSCYIDHPACRIAPA